MKRISYKDYMKRDVKAVPSLKQIQDEMKQATYQLKLFLNQ